MQKIPFSSGHRAEKGAERHMKEKNQFCSDEKNPFYTSAPFYLGCGLDRSYVIDKPFYAKHENFNFPVTQNRANTNLLWSRSQSIQMADKFARKMSNNDPQVGCVRSSSCFLAPAQDDRHHWILILDFRGGSWTPECVPLSSFMKVFYVGRP